MVAVFRQVRAMMPIEQCVAVVKPTRGCLWMNANIRNIRVRLRSHYPSTRHIGLLDKQTNKLAVDQLLDQELTFT